MRKVKDIADELIYIFTNYFVCNIPIWGIRLFLYKLLGVKIGKNSRILMKTIIVRPWRLEIGNNTIINERCYFDARGSIKIGNNVTIAVYTKFITGSHLIDDDRFPYTDEKIIVEDDCVVFANCTVLAGAYLKRGSLFCANSLIRKGIYKERTINAGNPAAQIRNRMISPNYSPESWNPLLR